VLAYKNANEGGTNHTLKERGVRRNRPVVGRWGKTGHNLKRTRKGKARTLSQKGEKLGSRGERGKLKGNLNNEPKTFEEDQADSQIC